MDGQRATEEQVQEIFNIVKVRGIQPFRLRKLLLINFFGAQSPRDLTFDRANRFIEELKKIDLSEDNDTRPITGKQIKKLHALKSTLKIADDNYRGYLHERFGVYTSKNLNYSQAKKLIDDWESTAISVGVWGRPNFKDKFDELGARPGMATPAQLRMVEGIWSELYREPDEKAQEIHLRRYLSKFFHISDMRFLDAEMVNKVLFALKTMQARKRQTPENAPETHFRGKADGWGA